MNKDKETIYEKITNKIIEKLEKGVVPWQKPWSCQEMAPKNLVSNKAYSGINSLHLATEGFTNPYWLTFKQAKELGGTIKKGEHGTSIIYSSAYNLETELENGKKEEKLLRYLKQYTVFNVVQTEGVEIPIITENVKNLADKIDSAELIISSYFDCPKVIMDRTRACYSPLLDRIEMPNKNDFINQESFYSTLFHELIHSTGHTSRLNREGIAKLNQFGSNLYSKEELIAEIGATFLCGHSGIENVVLDESVAYLKNWIKKLKGDSRLIIQAAAQAQKASNFILGNGGLGAI